MLHAFLTDNRTELIDLCRQKVSRRSPFADHDKLDSGIPHFVDQLTHTLHSDMMSNPTESQKISGPPEGGLASTTSEIAIAAGKHGQQLLERGFSIGQVVHDYGDLCQSVTELAITKHTSISAADFRTFNRCLDNAIAQAVTAYVADQGPAPRTVGPSLDEQLESLGGEMRTVLNSIALAFDTMQHGTVGFKGATALGLISNLACMRSLIDQSLPKMSA